MTTGADLYIGVDWSGARGKRLKALRVATCRPGDTAPQIILGPIDGDWSRGTFLDWLLAQVSAYKRVICGLDFSFCFPHSDIGAYFPGDPGSPKGVSAFWDMVDEACRDDDELYSGGLIASPRFEKYFHTVGSRGEKYQRRLRVAEQRCQEQGLGAPESVFNLVGARQVGKSSLSGMRMLNALRRRAEKVAIWPFDSLEGASCVMLETFPTAFLRLAGHKRGKVRSISGLNGVLAHFGSRAVDSSAPDISDDEADALVTAAALRALCPNEALWNPPGLSDRVRRYEGWTFGIE